MRDILALKLYTRVARLGSFSAAARECGFSQPQASRIVADLEAEIGTKLLTRTTRAVVPTEAGSEFLVRVEAILSALDEAENSVREGKELRGLIRVSMPASLAIHTIIPRLTAFTRRHPGLHVQMLLDDRRHDLVRDAVDVAIRLGRIVDASATVKVIGSIPRVVVASPAYLEQAGVPETPDDLARHRIIGGPAASAPTAWMFDRDGTTLSVELQPHFSIDENEGAVAAAVAALGITSTSRWSCARALAEGALVPVLERWHLQDIPIRAYFPMGPATRTAARALVDYLVGELRRDVNVMGS